MMAPTGCVHRIAVGPTAPFTALVSIVRSVWFALTPAIGSVMHASTGMPMHTLVPALMFLTRVNVAQASRPQSIRQEKVREGLADKLELTFPAESWKTFGGDVHNKLLFT